MTLNLSEKLQHLRQVEGTLRGLNRPLTKSEVVREMQSALGESISHAYLCQLEGGARHHMTARTRDLLARFFQVHPGYLVADPMDYATGLVSDLGSSADDFGTWLRTHAEELRDDPVIYHVLLKLARTAEPRRYFILLNRLLDLPPETMGRMLEQEQ